MTPFKKEENWLKRTKESTEPNFERGLLEQLNKYLHRLRSVWADIVLSEEDPIHICKERSVQASQLLRHPLRLSHPIIETISYLLIRKNGETPPPLRREMETLSIGELCQLALLKSLAGEDGQTLGRQILPFSAFPTLWCSEGSYHLKETESSLALLSNAFGRKVPISENKDPYFQALAKYLPEWEEVKSPPEGFPAIFQVGTKMSGAFVQFGNGVPLGALNSNSGTSQKGESSPPLVDRVLAGLPIQGVEVPAFGPQVHPLNDPKLFGIYRTISDSRYSAVYAQKDVWFETIPSLENQEIETRFVGLSPEKSISFVFYIKAESAKIDYEFYLPKSLRRYVGGVRKVTFARNETHFSIENTGSFKMELIPLAGGGCFWDSDFLLSYDIPIHDGRILFNFG